MTDLLITGGKVVYPDRTLEAAVAVSGGKVEGIGPEESFPDATRRIDATGCFVIPGLIDPHVHLSSEVLGDVAVDDYYSGTIAAALGGTTTIIDFAQQDKGVSVMRAVDRRLELAQGQAVIDYAFHATMTDGHPSSIADIKALVAQGIPSLKVFMLYRKEGMMMDDDGLVAVLKTAVDAGALVAVHAENAAIIEASTERFIAEGKTAPIYHSFSRPNVAEAEAVNRAIFLANYFGAGLYLVHLSAKEAIDLVGEARAAGQPVYGETCTHYLVLTEEMYNRPDGYKWIMSPPLRQPADCERLWEGLSVGHLSTIGSDECAWDRRIKHFGQLPFSETRNGSPGVEVRLPVVFSEGVNKGRLSVEKFVEVCATNPARIFGLYPQKGILEPGSDADIVIIDPNMEATIEVDTRYRRVDWLSTENMAVRGGVMMTISKGKVIVDRGVFTGSQGHGCFLPRRLDPAVLQQPL